MSGVAERGRQKVEFRDAVRDDLPAIVDMLADDHLGATREQPGDPLPDAYYQAFERMRAQVGNSLIVAVEGGSVVGCLQLVILPGIGRCGATRAYIEAVRVAGPLRGLGIGRALVEHAIEIARAEDCAVVQLTSDKSREDAHRFYGRLGFVASHVGMKLMLS